MDVKMVDRGEECELILSGRLDVNSSAEAEAAFLKLADRFKYITMDLKELKYISSAGLRVLTKVHRKLRQNGGGLTCKNVDNSIVQIFEMTGLTSFLAR